MLEGVFGFQVSPRGQLSASERWLRPARLAWLGAAVFGVALFSVVFRSYDLFDFRVFYEAGHHLLHGERIYPTRVELDQHSETYFVYPPFVAAVFVPFSLLPFPVAGALYTLLMVLATVATVRMLGVKDFRCYVALLFWIPILQSIGFGTIEAFLGLALATAWVHRRSNVVAPLALALAVAAKLFLWPLVFWLIATRRWRAALTSVVATIALIGLPWLLLGFRDFRWYPKALGLLLDHERAIGFSLRDVLGNLNLGVVALAIQGIAVVSVFWLARRDDGDRRSFSAAIVCALLLSPLVWIHYYALLVVPIALVRPRRSWLWFIPILAFWPPGNNPGVPLLTFAIVAILAGVGIATCYLAATPNLRLVHRPPLE
jgi:hypothetical protein